MSDRLAIAVDGGNVKTDVAIVDADGRLRSHVRGPCSSPHAIGMEGCVSLLAQLLGEAYADAGLDSNGAGARHGAAGLPAGGTGESVVAVAEIAHVLLAGADLPEEVAALQGAIEALGWARRLIVENDTLALLRTGTDRGWGVAVVCGGGINAIGVAPDGREVRFPALGSITGDWGGGYDVGVAALGAAHRSADGRGPRSSLERAVPAYFGLQTPLELASRIHYREIPTEALAELAPVVFAEAAADAAAAAILERLADEVSALAIATLERLELTRAGAQVVLGGGLLRAATDPLLARIRRRIGAVSPTAEVVVTPDGPIVGAALLGLDALGAGAGAIARARSEVSASVTKICI